MKEFNVRSSKMSRKVDDTVSMYLHSVFDGEISDRDSERGRCIADLNSAKAKEEFRALSQLRSALRSFHSAEQVKVWGPEGVSAVSLWNRLEQDLRHQRTPLFFRPFLHCGELLRDFVSRETWGFAGAVAVAIAIVIAVRPSTMTTEPPNAQLASKSSSSALTGDKAFPIMASIRNPNAYLAAERVDVGSNANVETLRPFDFPMTPQIQPGEDGRFGIRALRSRQPVRIVPGLNRNEPPLIWVGMGHDR